MKHNESALPKHAIDPQPSLHSNFAQGIWTTRKNQSRRRCLALVAVATVLLSYLSQLNAQNAGVNACLAREGRTPILEIEDTASYESKLFVTKDEVARYVFLTNANYDGDRSVAVYRARGKEGSLPGDYWATATIASHSLGTKDTRGVTVRRYDAPVPMSTARAVHELWLAILEGSRIDEKAVPMAPTAVISATTARGVRQKAVTVAGGSDSPCLAFCVALMRFGQSLINYPQIPEAQRAEAAREVEKEANHLLKRVRQ